MAKSRREKSQWGLEREGEGFLQRGQSRKARIEATTARRRLPPRFLLREDDGYEEEVNLREDRQRPE